MELGGNKDLFQTVFDSAANGIAVLQSIYNGKGKVEDFSMLLLNRYILDWIGDTDYKDKRYRDVFPLKQTGILEKFIHVAESGVNTNFEHWFTDDGMNHWFRFTAVKQGELVVVTIEDITERKQTEIALTEALKASEKQQRLYDSVNNTTPDLVYVFNLDYSFAYANKALLSMWGKREEDAIGKGLRENGYEEWHAQMHEREIDEIVATKKSIRGTVSFPHAELGSRIYDYILAPVVNDKGIVEAIAGITRDITDFKRTELNLKQSESHFRALVNASSDVIYSLNADWTVMQPLDGRGFLSDAHAAIEGWMDINVHPLDRAIVKETIAAAITNKSVFELEHRVVRVDGTMGWTFSRAVPILNDQGRIIEWFGAASDITERIKTEHALKISEEDLRNLVLQSPIGICVIDAATLLSEIVNDKFVEIAGKPYEDIMGKWYWDAFAELALYYKDALQEVIDTGKPFYVNEAELMLKRHGKEEVIYATFVYEPMKDSNGTVKKVVVWVLENTFQVQTRRRVEESESRYKILSESLEQQVNERTKELQRSNEDLQQFAHVASHDLKEPVRKIKTFTGRLEDQLNGKLDESATKFIGKIHVAAERMSNMIDGVLAYSTANAGKQKTESVDLNEVLKNIEVDLEIPLHQTAGMIQYAGLPVLEGARVLLYQLFYNLINNSIKFAKAGIAPRIIISSETYTENDVGLVRIQVEDNGIGFEPDLATQIFETFSRLNSKDKYEGTGLGLSLCKKIVERHGGTIVANGRKDIGAAFNIILPLKQQGISI